MESGRYEGRYHCGWRFYRAHGIVVDGFRGFSQKPGVWRGDGGSENEYTEKKAHRCAFGDHER